MRAHLLSMLRMFGRALVQRNLQACKTLTQNMRVNLRGAYTGVPRLRLHATDVTVTLCGAISNGDACREIGGRNEQSSEYIEWFSLLA